MCIELQIVMELRNAIVGILVLFLCFTCVNASNKRREPPVLLKISDLEECQSEIRDFCQNKKSNNFELLTCFNDNIPSNVKLSESCQHIIWQAKNNLTRAVSFSVNGISAQTCENDINEIADCKFEREENGPVIPCLLEFGDKVKNPTCKKYLNILKPIIFSDYRLTYKLVDLCSADIEKLHCGRTTEFLKDQGSTIDCLAESLDSLDKTCAHEVLKISELQSDNWNNDRPLFLACREDRERLCSHVQIGGGQVYDCLFKNKMNPEMSQKCVEKLRLRQKLQQKDFSVNFKFSSACHNDITIQSCDISDGKSGDYEHANLSKIILCLEEAKVGGVLMEPECLVEVKQLRFSLLEDHKINPEVVMECEKEIKYCESEEGNQPYVVHCLMKLAKTKGGNTFQSSSGCSNAVENLLMEVNIVDDFEVDPALLQDCNLDIEERCRHVNQGEGRVMDCLMSKADKIQEERPSCFDRLMEVQFFLSRNFKISRRLVSHCKKDAKNICSLDIKNMDPNEDSQLISCLYRNRQNVAGKCVEELNKLMLNRARSIDLPFAIQNSCMTELAHFCSDKQERDEEMFCLEDNYDALSDKCKEQVGKEVDQEQEGLPPISRMFVDACDRFVKENCEDGEDGSAIMKCLISNKNHAEMNAKCRKGIEHHQLMLMKDVKLSRSFNKFCNKELKAFCPQKEKKLKMVQCLSEHVYNDSMLGMEQRIKKPCREQLKFELLQMGENIDMNKDMQEVCQADREKFCIGEQTGNGEVIECLRKHQNELQVACRELLFNRELIEAVDSSVDYTLITKCKSMIKKHCREEPDQVFECLKSHRKDDGFDDECRAVLVNRMRLKSEDIRLNPDLLKDCKRDIEANCKKEFETTNKNHVEVEGLVIQCLRMTFVHKLRGAHMTTACKSHVSNLIKDSAIDYLQDAALVKACRPVIEKKCLREAERNKLEENGSEVEACLRESLISDSKIRDDNRQCFDEVLRRMNENKIDIQIDPVLNRLCQQDARTFCKDYKHGEGRVMSCLMNVMLDKSIPMNSECRKALKERSDLWSLSMKIAPPETFGELYGSIQSSSAKLYFQAALFLTVCLTFFCGLYSNRMVKKLRAMKRK